MTRNKLKEAAMLLFGEKGYDGTALSEIAKAVGVKTPAIYAFYENKEDLFITAFKEAMQAYNLFIQELSGDGDTVKAKANLYGVLLRQYQFSVKSRETNLFVLRTLLFPPSFLKDGIEEAFADSDQLLSKTIEQFMLQGMEEGSIPDQPVQPLVDAFLNLMDGLSMQFFYYNSKEVFERKLESAFSMFWRGAQQAAFV
ncbi:TetR/AcrR family transcriptional regulator [Paenibacillus sp. Marseille-Q4541]|uniref:TetR/AcrR family transcriptional regulator n=1 Tax=Paenibacillus sp. Marseille-Q4541 TaxID=2831522 RepID=UPI001BACB657|nr:TetR/AcrR family transcriptional regulator [Paenibacillus sp. Marseille-Q4541]